MPFLRFWRDKRGYEHTYLIHASTRKGAGARILYWFRTPPGVRVGRAAFDDEVRSALEAQYPSIAFDWSKLMDTPPPPPDVEHWRERRRLEKAARQARQAAERDDRVDDPSVGEDPGADETEPAELGRREAAAHGELPAADAVGVATVGVPAAETPPGDPDGRSRKRRRRGGRRRRKGGQAEVAAGPDAAAVSEVDDRVGQADGANPDAEAESGRAASNSLE